MTGPLWSRLDAMYLKLMGDVEGGRFDYIVLGGGCYGICFAHRVLELDDSARVLILEKGNILIPEHFQDLPSTYLDLLTHPDCFDLPWQLAPGTQLNIHPEVPYVGGRSLMWNAWVPQPTRGQLAAWPSTVVQALAAEWQPASKLLGRRAAIEIGGRFGELHLQARERLAGGLGAVLDAEYCPAPSALECVMATRETDALHGWRRFAAINVLMEDIHSHGDRLTVVGNAPVERVVVEQGRATAVQTAAATIPVGEAQVLIATATIPATTLALRSLPEERLIGNNLLGHLRSQAIARVPRAAFDLGEEELEVGALYVPGADADGREFHVHVSLVSNPRPDEQQDDLYRVHPDPSLIRWTQDADHIGIALQGLGELPGERQAGARNRVTLAGEETLVQVQLTASDEAFWSRMEEAMRQTSEILAGGHRLEFVQADGSSWSTSWPDPAALRDTSLVHEAGTLWMGEDPATSVTDVSGRFHRVENLHAAPGASLPTAGSWNPTYTGVGLVFRMAGAAQRKQACTRAQAASSGLQSHRQRLVLVGER